MTVSVAQNLRDHVCTLPYHGRSVLPDEALLARHYGEEAADLIDSIETALERYRNEVLPGVWLAEVIHKLLHPYTIHIDGDYRDMKTEGQ